MLKEDELTPAVVAHGIVIRLKRLATQRVTEGPPSTLLLAWKWSGDLKEIVRELNVLEQIVGPNPPAATIAWVNSVEQQIAQLSTEGLAGINNVRQSRTGKATDTPTPTGPGVRAGQSGEAIAVEYLFGTTRGARNDARAPRPEMSLLSQALGEEMHAVVSGLPPNVQNQIRAAAEDTWNRCASDLRAEKKAADFERPEARAVLLQDMAERMADFPSTNWVCELICKCDRANPSYTLNPQPEHLHSLSASLNALTGKMQTLALSDQTAHLDRQDDGELLKSITLAQQKDSLIVAPSVQSGITGQTPVSNGAPGVAPKIHRALAGIIEIGSQVFSPLIPSLVKEISATAPSALMERVEGIAEQVTQRGSQFLSSGKIRAAMTTLADRLGTRRRTREERVAQRASPDHFPFRGLPNTLVPELRRACAVSTESMEKFYGAIGQAFGPEWAGRVKKINPTLNISRNHELYKRVNATYDGGNHEINLHPKVYADLDQFRQGDRTKQSLDAFKTLLHEILHAYSPARRDPSAGGPPPPDTGPACLLNYRWRRTEEGIVEWAANSLSSRVLDRKPDFRKSLMVNTSYVEFVVPIMDLWLKGGDAAVSAVWAENTSKERSAVMKEERRRTETASWSGPTALPRRVVASTTLPLSLGYDRTMALVDGTNVPTSESVSPVPRVTVWPTVASLAKPEAASRRL